MKLKEREVIPKEKKTIDILCQPTFVFSKSVQLWITRDQTDWNFKFFCWLLKLLEIKSIQICCTALYPILGREWPILQLPSIKLGYFKIQVVNLNFVHTCIEICGTSVKAIEWGSLWSILMAETHKIYFKGFWLLSEFKEVRFIDKKGKRRVSLDGNKDIRDIFISVECGYLDHIKFLNTIVKFFSSSKSTQAWSWGGLMDKSLCRSLNVEIVLLEMMVTE